MKTKFIGIVVLTLLTVGLTFLSRPEEPNYKFADLSLASLMPVANAQCEDIPPGWCNGYTKTTPNCYEPGEPGKPDRWCGVRTSCSEGGTEESCASTSCSDENCS